jgi:hypothetical protein
MFNEEEEFGEPLTEGEKKLVEGIAFVAFIVIVVLLIIKTIIDNETNF